MQVFDRSTHYEIIRDVLTRRDVEQIELVED